MKFFILFMMILNIKKSDSADVFPLVGLCFFVLCRNEILPAEKSYPQFDSAP